MRLVFALEVWVFHFEMSFLSSHLASLSENTCDLRSSDWVGLVKGYDNVYRIFICDFRPEADPYFELKLNERPESTLLLLVVVTIKRILQCAF